MQIELSLVVMAGVVLSLFLIVGEIAALRKRAKRTRMRLLALHANRRYFRLTLELCVIAALVLMQPASSACSCRWRWTDSTRISPAI